MKICVAGQGAFGIKHLEAIANIDGIEVVSLAGGNPAGTEEVAKRFGIPHWTTNLAESLAQPGVEAAILTTPTQMHADQGEQCMRAGKHVMIEIPMADSLKDSERLVQSSEGNGPVAMAGHTRRFNPSHQWIRKRILAGELKILVDGCADVLLPPHQHERRRQAAELDGPPALAPRLSHSRSVPISDRRNRSSRQCSGRSDSSGSQDRDGYEYSAEGPVGRGVHARAYRSTTRVRWARFSATSAITEPTSRVMTIWWMATSSRSTCRKWLSR